MTWRKVTEDPLARTMTGDRGAHRVSSHFWLNKLPEPYMCVNRARQGQEQTLCTAELQRSSSASDLSCPAPTSGLSFLLYKSRKE